MNNQILSELLDGELNAEEMDDALDRLIADPELQSSWYRMHILRSAIRDNGVYASGDIVEKVSAALADEPTIMAPDNLALESVGDTDRITVGKNVIPLGLKRSKVMAYTAVAASFAALVMVSFNSQKVSSPPIADSTTSAPTSQAIEQELQSMVVQHGEFSGKAALNGLVAYAKVVDGSIAGNTRLIK